MTVDYFFTIKNYNMNNNEKMKNLENNAFEFFQFKPFYELKKDLVDFRDFRDIIIDEEFNIL